MGKAIEKALYENSNRVNPSWLAQQRRPFMVRAIEEALHGKSNRGGPSWVEK